MFCMIILEEVQEMHPLLNMDGVRRGNRVVMRGRGMEREWCHVLYDYSRRGARSTPASWMG